MGRSLTCLFLKSDNPRDVAKSFSSVLEKQGTLYTFNKKPVSLELYQLPHNWVAVPIDQLIGADRLITPLNEMIATDLLFVWTNDSSSWHFDYRERNQNRLVYYQLGSEEAAIEELGGFDPDDPSTFANVEALHSHVPSVEPQDWSSHYDKLRSLFVREVNREEFNNLLNTICYEHAWGAEQFAGEFLDLVGIPKLFMQESRDELLQMEVDDLEYYDSARVTSVTPGSS